uniref:Uncharacterized protein n=1 Tax=viral metagenome TaxID=1070528 RepID=A0A6C0E594_9ZZZZ
MNLSVIPMNKIRYILIYSLLPLFSSIATSFVVLYLVNQKIIINNPPNAWSSFAYAAIDAPLCLKYPLFVLSVSSFNLWSRAPVYIDIIDVTSIFWVNINVTIYVLPGSKYKYKIIYAINGIVTLLLLYTIFNRYELYVFDYYGANMIPDVGIVYVYSGLILSAFHIKDENYLTGLLCIISGFNCKLLDLYKGQDWGTCVFHMLTALGTNLVIKVNNLHFVQEERERETHPDSAVEPAFNSMHIQGDNNNAML